jgi:hypothetical protein
MLCDERPAAVPEIFKNLGFVREGLSLVVCSLNKVLESKKSQRNRLTNLGLNNKK